MEIWIATGNKGKLDEFKLILRDIPGLQIHSQSELSSYTPPPENGKTFEENARIKARSLRAVKNNVWVLGEDTGLEVEGLGGLPGVHTARYAGPHARDSENIAKLLKMMAIRVMPNRNAQFTCCLVAYSPTGEEFVFTGSLKGTIAKKISLGAHGFGYDPVFLPEGQDKTLAELPPIFKNQHSHRAQVTKQFMERCLK